MGNLLRNAFILGYLLFFAGIMYKVYETGLLGQLMAK